MPTELNGDFSRILGATCVLEIAWDSSKAERLHDLARNSMDSVGVSGRARDTGSQLAGAFSSMFSSRRNKHLETHELTDMNN